MMWLLQVKLLFERRICMGDKGSAKKAPKMSKKEARAAKIAARSSKNTEEA